jgi:putative transcriptional regulator
MDSLQGHLLLASEELADPNFARSVVLLIEHNEQGALGVILNRPTSKTVRELWREVSQAPCESQRPVCLGGPVSGPVMALHTLPALAEVEVVAGVYFAAKKQHLDQLVSVGEAAAAGSPPALENPFKIFVGHAGWGPGQLEQEIRQRAWYTLPATSEHVFAAEADLWQRLLQGLDRLQLPALLKIKHIPVDPALN